MKGIRSHKVPGGIGIGLKCVETHFAAPPETRACAGFLTADQNFTRARMEKRRSLMT